MTSSLIPLPAVMLALLGALLAFVALISIRPLQRMPISRSLLAGRPLPTPE